MLSGIGLGEYTDDGEAIRRFSSPLEQMDRMLAPLEARCITFERAREIAQAEFDVAEIDTRSGMELDPTKRNGIGSTRVCSSDHTLRVGGTNFPEMIFQCPSSAIDFLPP